MGWKAYPVRERIRITGFYTFFRHKYGSDYHFQGETHDFWEFLYVIRGSVCVSADDKVYNLTEGSIIFHKPMEFHKFHITGCADAEVLVVSFSAEGELTEFFCNKVFSLDYNQKDVVAHILEYASKWVDRDNKLFENYMGVFDGDGKDSQYICLCFYRLFLLLAESDNVMPVSGTPDSMIFAKTVKYMNRMVCETVTLDDFAKNANVSVSKLKRIFARYAGVGVHRYFLMLKLKIASELLEEGMSVTEVAEKTGFSSQGYFSNVFKREKGYSPSEVC